MTETSAAWPKTHAILERGISEQLHLGAQAYISIQGQPLLDLALGEVRPDEPLKLETLMPWLSAGKPLTAIAIAQLVERGLLEIDQPVTAIIPEFGANGKSPITLRHLLTHTGGFRSADKFPEALCWPEMIARICKAPLEEGWIPGQKAGYHTASSWFMLGEIAQRVDGRALDLYLRQEVLVPCGMLDSWIGMPAEDYKRYGSRIGLLPSSEKGLFNQEGDLDSESASTPCRPGSNARGPIRELGKFYEMLLHGGELNSHRILASESVEWFTKRERIGLFDHTFMHKLDFGLGFIINSNRYGITTVPYGYGPHASEETFGHSGAQSSCAFADPAHGLVVAWVCNGRPGERRHQQRAREINAAIYEDLGLV